MHYYLPSSIKLYFFCPACIIMYIILVFYQCIPSGLFNRYAI